MSTASFQQFPASPQAKKRVKGQAIVWLSLSLAVAIFYAFLGLQEAFASQYTVQDDARQHVFWMQRFIDPDLFPNDLIADYFQAVAPAGYKAVYALGAALGIAPLLLNKFLPLGLGLVTTGYCFGTFWQLFPVPMAAFVSTVLLNQALWMKDDLVSATPRAFAYPLLLAFLYYLLRRSLVPCLIAIALQGLFYPQCLLISAGVLVLQPFNWQGNLRINRRDCGFCIAGLAVAFFVSLPFVFTSSEFHPVVSVTEAKMQPEFFSGGRASFFDDDSWEFWIEGDRSGIFSFLGRIPDLMYGGLLLPLLLRFPKQFPLADRLSGKTKLLAQLTLVSVGLFALAHALLFRLHLPSRYTQHSLRIVLAMAAAIAIALLGEKVARWIQPLGKQGRLLTTGTVLTLLVLSPTFSPNFPKTSYKTGDAPALYEFFSQQPKDSLIASLTSEADNLPALTGRSVLVAREYGIPYHQGYYRQFRQRASDLIQAQYASDRATLRQFIEQYAIDFWILEAGAFSREYFDENEWLNQYQPAATQAKARLEQGETPALADLIESCSVLQTGDFTVLEAKCLLATPS